MENKPFIHPTAIVEKNVTLAEGVKIWHHCHVREGAQIGEGTSIGKNCFIDAGVKIGSHCKIQNNVSVYTGVTLESDVFVGPSAVFTNDLYPRAFSQWSPEKAFTTLVKKGASIGAGACIRCGLVLGQYCMIGMGAVLTKNPKDFELWLGNPATCSGLVDKMGKRVK